ncbi:aquaporin Z [Paraburkholderia sp. BL8N3]|nr:aquaporin Z [Paraburkholderia sp. BL8N3]TCK42489.1 aquaporin Z [Paraburkholderia sp. BL8N3]
MIRRLTAECAGTFWLVFIGCGVSVLGTVEFAPDARVLEQALAFGLSVTTASYVFRSISGGHFNPAVTVGLAIANRFPIRDLLPYILAQVTGAIAGAMLLGLIASGRPGFGTAVSSFGANGYSLHSPGDYQLCAAFAIELVMTFAFVTLNLAATRSKSARLDDPLVIGLTTTLIYIVTIPVTGGSVNPARSTGPAIVVGGWALDDLWLFWAAPLAGALLAGLSYPAIFGACNGEDGADPKISDTLLQ